MRYLFNILLPLLIFLHIFVAYFHSITAMTQDLGRHFLAGKIIIQNFSIPKTNLFSYIYPQFPFINHHWLSEVMFYKIAEILGVNWLVIFTTLIVAATFFMLYFFIRPTNNQAIFIASVLYLRVLFERTDVRPEIFSFLFLSIFIVILYKNREKITRWIFILPFIELLWVNMHIYFPIGIAVLGLFLIDEFIFCHTNPNTKIRNKKQVLNLPSNFDSPRFGEAGIRILNLLLIFLMSIFATLLNPNGFNGALYPFRVFQNYGYQIEENQNIFFLWDYLQKPTILFFALSVIMLFTSLFLTIKKSRPIDWLLSVFFSILAISAIRNFPLFVFGTFVPLAYALKTVSRQLYLKQSSLTKTTILIVFILVSVWQIMDISKTRTFGWHEETGASNGVNFFIENKLKGPIFNNFDIGSYLAYRLFPNEKVFVDGRPEAYPAAFFQNTYIPMQMKEEIFNKEGKKHNFNTIFFAHTDQTPWAESFLKQIVNNHAWKMVYLDDYAVIFVRNNNKNKLITEKFVINQKDLLSLFRLARFFNLVNFKDQELSVYKQILIKNPYSCPAIYNLTSILAQKNDPAAPIFLNRYQQTCSKSVLN